MLRAREAKLARRYVPRRRKVVSLYVSARVRLGSRLPSGQTGGAKRSINRRSNFALRTRRAARLIMKRLPPKAVRRICKRRDCNPPGAILWRGDLMDLSIFIAGTAAAVVLQAGILLAMYLAVRKTSARVGALAEEVRTKVLPTVETAQSMLVELRPKIETAVANVSETTSMIRAQLQRIDATVSDVIDRSRLQVIRADDLVTRTLDKVEET